MNQQYLSERMFKYALPSAIIGLSILTLPTSLAKVTAYSDGWITIVIAGIIATLFALLAVHIASHFPGKPFLEYAGELVTRPIAIVIAFIFVFIYIILSGFTVRSVAYIAQQYLFERTPMEVLGLVFLLVVIYGVAGDRIGIFRLNLLFLPIILIVFLMVGLFNMKSIEVSNYFPLFKTSFKGYLAGTWESFMSFLGFGMGIFYVFMIKEPFNLSKKVMVGISIPVIFYVFIFMSTIGVFNNMVASNLTLPTLELALKVDIPGAIFERVDAFVYTIWIMAVFNTITILYDIATLLIMSIFTKFTKPITVFIMGTIIFFIGMFPKSMDTVHQWSKNINTFTAVFTIIIIMLLYIMIKWKGITRHESL